MSFRTARVVARRLDDLPFAPRRVGDALVDRHLALRRRRARQDPEWAAIEERRTRDTPPGHSTFLSEDLTWEDWDRQREIASRLTPPPAWFPVAAALSRASALTAVHEVALRVQRARRGWADMDAWNLGGRLCATLGAQLLFLSETASGWPGNEEFPTYETWVEALAHHGRVLAAADDDDEEEQAVARAASLHWVADHLGHLWD